MNSTNMVIVTLDKDRKILDTQNFISDDQFQKVMTEANKKGCTAKMLAAVNAKHYRDNNLSVDHLITCTEPDIQDTAENWENGTLGCDEQFVGVVPESELQDINEALGLEKVSLLLEEELFNAYKEEATKRGLGHKTLMRVALKQFIGYRSDRDEELMSENKN